MVLAYFRSRTDGIVIQLLGTVRNDFKLLLNSPLKSQSLCKGLESLPLRRQALVESMPRILVSLLGYCTPQVMFKSVTTRFCIRI